MLRGKPFLLDTRPLAEAAGEQSAGGVITLHAPSRIGERLHAVQHAEGTGFATILGESAPIRALKARAARVALVDAPLLLRGETKSLLDAFDLDLARSSISGRDTLADHAVSVHEVPSWDEAVEKFEKELLQRLYPFYPSSRKLAAYLKTSHTRIADKLRKFGIC